MTDVVRTQILATEHWSPLATRSMTWNEIFSRAMMFMTVLSAAVVGIALEAQMRDAVAAGGGVGEGNGGFPFGYFGEPDGYLWKVASAS